MEYNFFEIGMKHAEDELVNLKKMASEIGKEYGSQAKMEFEAGVSAAIPVYKNNEDINAINEANEDLTAGSLDYGKRNERNNSYFGTAGTGVQYVTNPNGTIKYNEPKGKTK